MSVTGVRTPVEYEERLARYLFERSEEGRAVRVGEKETSEQAAIVERYRDLFSPGQLDVLREAEDAADGDERERLYRLRKTCEAGIVSGRAGRARGRAREPDPGRPRRLARRGAAAADRAGEARGAAGLRRPRRAGHARERRERPLQRRPPRPARRGRGARGGALRRARRDRAQRRGEGDLAARARAGARRGRACIRRRLRRGCGERWFEKLLGPERDDVPTSNHTSYLRRLSPLEQTYTKERAVEVCVATLSAIGLEHGRDARDPARSRRPAAEVAARLRDRVRPAERRPPDHARPGRAARLPGVPARGRATRSTTRASTRRCRTRSASSRATTR